KMPPSLAPVDAGAAQWAPVLLKRRNIDAYLFEPATAGRRQLQDAVSFAQHLAGEPPLEQGDRQTAGEMVVARPRMAHSLVARAGTGSEVADTRGDRDQPFHGSGDVGIGEAKVTCPALPACLHQAGVFKLGEMTACGG